jgi:CHAT domain-containing protein
LALGCGGRKPPAPPPPDSASLFRRAEAAYHRGDLAAAQSEAKLADRALSGKDIAWDAKFRLLEADVLIRRGLNQPLLDLLRPLQDDRVIGSELATHKYLLETTAYYRLGEDEKAEASFQAAEKACPANDPGMAADVEVVRGVSDEGDWPKAEAYFHRALALAQQAGDSFRETGALLDLGVAASMQEHYDESMEWLLRARDLAARRGYGLEFEKASGSLGWDDYKLGDLDKALALSQEAAEKALALSADRDQSIWLNNVGLIFYQRGDNRQAESYYRRSLAIDRRLENKHFATIALTELSFVSIQRNELGQAEQFADQALNPDQNGGDRPVQLTALLAKGLVAQRSGRDREAERVLSEVARDPANDRRSVRWEAQAALADLYATERREALADAEFRAALDTVRRARCDVRREELRLPFLNNATHVYDRYIDFLVQRGKADQALKTADESRALTLAEGLGVEGKRCLAAESNFDPRRTARQADATLLFYWLGSERSYLWAVAPDRSAIFPLPAAAQIEPTVQAYRKTLLGPRDALDAADANGLSLYRTLVAPAQELLRPRAGGAARRVIVVADGSLSGLSFDTLICPAPRPHYWIEDVAVENASSLRLLSGASRPRSALGRKLLLIGDPAPPSGGDFRPLPNAAGEMRSVAGYFTAASERVYGRGDSTPAAYIGSHPEDFAYIHFVAHGTASLSDPLDSAVILSPEPSARGAGLGSGVKDAGYKLYAREILAHRLRADLVTVSACQGAGVRAYAGEGLVGLSWAFLHAGAHHVIGALWDVSDEATPQLMAAMYAELVKGASPAAALRDAKLSLLRSGTAFRKPYYWAAFQLYAGS